MNPNYQVPQPIIEAYIFANTPSYLFKKMIGNDFIHKLLFFENDELLNLVGLANPKDVASIALSYAAAVALLKKGISGQEITDAARETQLVWIENMVLLFNQTIPKSTTITLRSPKLVMTTTQNTSHSLTTNQIIKIGAES
jgi:hypothetical protein